MDDEGYLTMSTTELHRLEILGRVRGTPTDPSQRPRRWGSGCARSSVCRTLRNLTRRPAPFWHQVSEGLRDVQACFRRWTADRETPK